MLQGDSPHFYGSSLLCDDDLDLTGLIHRGSVQTMDKLHIYTVSVKMAPAWNLVEEIQLMSVTAEQGISLLVKENLNRNDFV